MVGDDSGATGRARAGFGATMIAVLWSFFGVRRRTDLERDAARLNPVAVVVAALLATAALVGGLLLVVRSVVR